VQIATLTGTFGLAATESVVFAFTRNVVATPPAISVPGVSLVYQKIPNASTAQVQTDYDTFNGKIYLAVHDPGVAYSHYYDGVLVTEASAGNTKGIYVRTYRSKVYSVLGTNLFFSKIGDPMIWNDPTVPPSSGFINLSNQDSGGENLTSLEVYYDKLAVFSSVATQLWGVDPDPLAERSRSNSSFLRHDRAAFHPAVRFR
jgi:hypothetical protein